MAIHVFIPTLQGLSHVQNIIKEDADVPAVICLNGTSQSLPISNAYYDFVKKGQGVIAKDFGHAAWRIDLSEPVEMGNSWQLGIYIAHYLYSINELGTGDLKKGDTVIWATGEVKANRDITPVEGVERKLQQSSSLFNEFKNKHIQIVVVMSESNYHLLDLPNTLQTIALRSCNDLSPLFSQLECTYREKHQLKKCNKKVKIAIAAVLTLIGLLTSIYYQTYIPVDNVASPNTIEQANLQKEPMIQQEILFNSPQLSLLSEVENAAVAHLNALKKTPDQDCDDISELSTHVHVIEPDKFNYFTPLSFLDLCEISISFGDKPIASAYLYSTSSDILLPLPKAKQQWLIPLPSIRTKTRKAILLGFEKPFSDAEQVKLKRFLSINFDDEGMSTKNIEKMLSDFGFGAGTIFSFTLSP